MPDRRKHFKKFVCLLAYPHLSSKREHEHERLSLSWHGRLCSRLMSIQNNDIWPQLAQSTFTLTTVHLHLSRRRGQLMGPILGLAYQASRGRLALGILAFLPIGTHKGVVASWHYNSATNNYNNGPVASGVRTQT